MLFSSNLFLFTFLPAVLLLYFGLKLVLAGIPIRAQTKSGALNFVLFLASLFFFYWGSGKFTLLFVVSILGNYYLGEWVWRRQGERTIQRRILLLGSTLNLLVLGYFKYKGFFLDQLVVLSTLAGHPITPGWAETFLPFGISFYTFMAISYLVECSKGETRAPSALSFATYLAMFPHLIAGPIVRYSEIAEELRVRTVSLESFSYGIWRFAKGMFKKVVLAGYLGQAADRIFALPAAELTPVLAWGGALAYTFQIYFDFSGYSDMAIGLARFFGFHFPENFNKPYLAASITEFWRRWHMTLSRWFRDFLYIPLGGNRGSPLRTYCNLGIVFFLCGLWHGAAWHFVVWGMFHGLLLIAERIMKERWNVEPSGLPGIAGTFLLTVIGWVFFRAQSLSQASTFLQTMVGLGAAGGDGPFALHYYFNSLTVGALLIALAAAFFPQLEETRINKRRLGTARRIFALPLLIVSIVILSKSAFSPFIYFQF